MEDLGELHGDANKTSSISQQTTGNKQLLCASTELPMRLKVQSRGSQVLLTPRLLAPVPSNGFPACSAVCQSRAPLQKGKELSMPPNLLMPWLGWWLFPYWDPAQKEFMERGQKILKSCSVGYFQTVLPHSWKWARLDRVLSKFI